MEAVMKVEQKLNYAPRDASETKSLEEIRCLLTNSEPTVCGSVQCAQRAIANGRECCVIVIRLNNVGAVMVGKNLHTFDLHLCDYAIHQIRPHLFWLPERPRQPLPKLGHTEYRQLSFSEWMGREVASLPEPLADYIWAEVSRKPVLHILNDHELSSIGGLVEEGRGRQRINEWLWLPCPFVHGQYLDCLGEIRDNLAQAVAERWAQESLVFGDQLCAARLQFITGIGIVRKWLRNIRELLKAMKAMHYLPAPEGTLSTPTSRPHIFQFGNDGWDSAADSTPTLMEDSCTLPISAGAERGNGGSNAARFFPLTSWNEILVALNELYEKIEWKNTEQIRDKIRKLNDMHNGPIMFPPGKGKHPSVDRAALMAWWEELSEHFVARKIKQDADAKSVRLTVADSHNYGMTGKVLPGISGSEVVRTRAKPGEKGKERER